MYVNIGGYIRTAAEDTLFLDIQSVHNYWSCMSLTNHHNQSWRHDFQRSKDLIFPTGCTRKVGKWNLNVLIWYKKDDDWDDWMRTCKGQILDINLQE